MAQHPDLKQTKEDIEYEKKRDQFKKLTIDTHRKVKNGIINYKDMTDDELESYHNGLVKFVVIEEAYLICIEKQIFRRKRMRPKTQKKSSQNSQSSSSLKQFALWMKESLSKIFASQSLDIKKREMIQEEELSLVPSKQQKIFTIPRTDLNDFTRKDR